MTLNRICDRCKTQICNKQSRIKIEYWGYFKVGTPHESSIVINKDLCPHCFNVLFGTDIDKIREYMG